MSTIAHHAALTAPLTVNGMTVDELLAFHHARFGDARMSNDDASATAGAGTGTGTAGDGTGAAGTGTGDAGGTSGTTGTGTAATATQAPAQQTQQAAAPAWNADAWDGKVESLPKDAQKIITDLRKADGDERVAKKTLDAIVNALNPDAEGDKPDPVKLAQQLTDSQTDSRQSKIELEVYRTASEHGGNPAALTDSRTFLAKVAGLDPTAEDFRTKVIDAAKAAVTENNTLAAARAAAGASTVNHAGGSGEGLHDLDAQIAEATKKGDHALAIRLKRQKAYTQPTT